MENIIKSRKHPVENRMIIYIAQNTGQHLSKIAKDIDVTYSHITKKAQELESKGFIITHKIGRERIVEPTKKTNSMAQHCLEVAKLKE
jgi:DNA-binding MarR family transcriptional regulator